MPPHFRRLLIPALFIFFAILAALLWIGNRKTPPAPPKVPEAVQVDVKPDWCGKLVQHMPEVPKAMCEDIGLQPTGVRSVKGFPILARDYESDGKRKEPLRILLIGGIHGDEPTSAAIVFHWLQNMHLPIAHSFQWRVAPVVNPDGLFANPQTRVNANGVDLNRNFASPNWERDAPKYWKNRTKSDPRRYPGQAPLSQPESQWVHDTIEHFRPHLVISVHAPLGEVDFDGAHDDPPHRFGPLMYNRIGVYPGSLGNYGVGQKPMPVITIELEKAKQMPSKEEIKRIWRDMLIWINYNIAPSRVS